MSTVCVIPARGGSQRIPRKNIRDFFGKPMIEYAINAAQESEVFDEIIVSTDDDEIATVARRLGAGVPFMRPSKLADHHTSTIPVIRHAIESMTPDFQFVACIYPTVPFLSGSSIREGFKKITSNEGLEFVMSVTEYDFSIHRALLLNETDEVSMIWPENELVRSQDLPCAYHDAAQFYFGTNEAWLNQDKIYSSRCAAIDLPRSCSIDLDTPEDWEFAENIYAGLQSR